MKGLIAFDIDGTLTHRLGWIDPKVVQFLKAKPAAKLGIIEAIKEAITNGRH